MSALFCLYSGGQISAAVTTGTHICTSARVDHAATYARPSIGRRSVERAHAFARPHRSRYIPEASHHPRPRQVAETVVSTQGRTSVKKRPLAGPASCNLLGGRLRRRR